MKVGIFEFNTTNGREYDELNNFLIQERVDISDIINICYDTYYKDENWRDNLITVKVYYKER